MRTLLVLVCLVLSCLHSQAQEALSTDKAATAIDAMPSTQTPELSDKLITTINRKYKRLNDRISRQTTKYIDDLEKQEEKLQRELTKKDSNAAKQLAIKNKIYFAQLRKKMEDAQTHPKEMNQYIPNVDSLTVASRFLNQNSVQINDPAIAKALATNTQQLQGRMQAAAEIRRLMTEHKNKLRKQLGTLGVDKQLNAISKQTYYYNQQVAEYKSLLKDKHKAQQKLLSVLKQHTGFNTFMQQNSFLGKLFPQPQQNEMQVLPAGFSSRQDVLKDLQARFGNDAASLLQQQGNNPIQQQIDKAKKQYGELKNKTAELTKEKVADADMPHFKPNSQKTKTFGQRLQWGFNMQSTKSNRWLPATSDIAITIGYKLNDKAVIGIGGSYKMGWGSDWQNIQLTTQGMGIRTFTDIKLPKAKGWIGLLTRNIWITGGYEWNYTPAIAEKNAAINDWQQACLLGISKKIKTGKKTAQVQLLYNLLNKQNTPYQQPLVLRIGWVK